MKARTTAPVSLVSRALAVVLLSLVAFCVSLLVVASRAEAHTVGLSTGEYSAKAQSVTVKLTFARGEVANVLPDLDENRDGHVTALEVQTASKDLESKVLRRILVTRGGAACGAPVLLGATLTEQDGLMIDGRFDCAGAGRDGPFDVDVQLLEDLSRGHRHVARAVGATTRDEVLYAGHSKLSITPALETSDAPGPAATPPPADTRQPSSAWSFFKMGVEHILTGYDHLVFLFGLVLLRARLKQLLAVITAFTLAHSITLAIAALGVFTPSPRIIEPAIALSIAYVGIENFFVKDASRRWRITFPFGLVHGFGFAGALREINLPRAQIPVALVTFNLGVEVGQLLVMAIVLPLIIHVRKESWFEPAGVRVLSGAVAIAGIVWFVLRVASG